MTNNMQHHSPIIYVANTGAILSQLAGHIGEVAGALTIIVNIAVLYRMMFPKRKL